MPSELLVERYKIEQEVGRGGMGVVLRAYDITLNRAVALKMLPPVTTNNRELCRRLRIEARAASAVSHPAIATVYDFVERDQESFIVYEFVEGRTLRKELERGHFTIEDTLDVGVQLTSALIAAHAHGITHRDIKPENIMLAPDDYSGRRVKILDFGLAKHHRGPLTCGQGKNEIETASMETAAGLLLGTVSYMAPEQLESKPADSRTDIYALGLVLYEMAAGANPFVGNTTSATIANILKEDAPPTQKKNPTVPAELDRILLKCLRKHAEDRYQTARELLMDLCDLRSNFAGAQIAEPGEIEPSLLQRFFKLFGKTPYRRWEIMHLRMILWCLLLAYLGWRFMASAPDKWGFALFFLEIACIALLITLLGFLVYTGASNRGDLLRVIRRMAPWIRGSTVALVFVTWAMAGIAVASHRVLAAFLLLCGTAGGLKYLLFKAAFDSDAFPEPRQK
jgi:predicted Ser/Thr protein kinase